jgi:K+-transporting ATPase ATPase A chain
MNASGWIQLGIYVALLVALTKPMGVYLVKVLDPSEKTFLDPLLKWLEKLIYAILRVDPKKEQSWKQYGVAMLVFSLVSMTVTYGLIRLQPYLPFYHNLTDGAGSNLTAMTPDLAFNTAASFATNTNWQNYAGENTMSYFSQMVALVSHNFFSAAVGICVAAIFVRGIARDRAKTIGNFWADLVRLNLYLLMPICVVYALFLISQGMIDNFKPYTSATMVEHAPATQPAMQTIVQGPMASQIAIKMLGTNGGGYVNANAAHPFENPTPLSNFIQMLSIFLIPSGLTYYLGRVVKNQRHGWAVWAAMASLFLVGVICCWAAESSGNPRMTEAGLSATDGNMEGKEVRFGIFNSALFATITTDASCGAVNCMHDSFTPLGGLVPLFNIHLGEIVFGGVGSGLYGMLVFVVIAIFIAGLMVGRTPEYLGKKIDAYDIKVASLSILILTFDILCFTAWACISPTAQAQLGNGGPHGFSEMHYAFTSCTGNNGSAFAGLSGNVPWWNVNLAICALIGRYLMIVPIVALAGSLAKKKLIPQSTGSFPVSGGTFVTILVGTVLIVGALSFLPALSLGPIVEHFIMVTKAHPLF